MAKLTPSEIYGMGFDEIDLFGEYSIVEFNDGETSIMRNSFVDIFKLY